MKNKLLQTILFVGASAVSADLSAKQSLNVTSHSIQINGQTFDYSIGEMTLVNTEKTSSLIVTQGFLQPNTQRQESSTTSDNAFSQLDNPIKVYPNPTTDILQIDDINLPVQLTISNVNGQIIFQQDLEKNQLDLDKYPCGIYFISLKNDQIFKTFKIVKID